jgi:hypothetical protein
MASGEAPQPGEGPAEASHGGPARQREILAQFEAAIAGMRTREIQIGLRQLLGGSLPPPRTAETATAPPDTRAPGHSGNGNGNGAGAETGRTPPDAGTGLPGPHTTNGTRPGREAGSGPVTGLIGAIRTPSARRQMERLIEDAELERPSQVDATTAARVVRPYTWLLNWVGPEGIRLTEAGHLPPAQVTEAMCELNLAADGHGRRENQVRGVRQLRESAQAMGLLRKQRRQLLLTARAGELRSDPAALWWHLAERMPLRSAAAGEVQPGLVLLICVAARSTDTLHATIARMLSAIGWMNSDGSPLSGEDAARVTSCTEAVLRRLGALAEDPCPGYAPWPTPEGVSFTRAALRTWPGPGG